MSDEALRLLERRAREGDPQAQARLPQERARHGELLPDLQRPSPSYWVSVLHEAVSFARQYPGPPPVRFGVMDYGPALGCSVVPFVPLPQATIYWAETLGANWGRIGSLKTRLDPSP